MRSQATSPNSPVCSPLIEQNRSVALIEMEEIIEPPLRCSTLVEQEEPPPSMEEGVELEDTQPLHRTQGDSEEETEARMMENMLRNEQGQDNVLK